MGGEEKKKHLTARQKNEGQDGGGFYSPSSKIMRASRSSFRPVPVPSALRCAGPASFELVCCSVGGAGAEAAAAEDGDEAIQPCA
jgi:hypothetical protein